MKSNTSGGKWALAVLAIVSVTIACAYFFNQGYGEVSPDAYEVSKALYGTCLAKSEARLEAVESLANGETEREIKLSPKERRWIKLMIDDARNGKWKSASQSARRMMEDQVEY